jgi:hypothetical protein
LVLWLSCTRCSADRQVAPPIAEQRVKLAREAMRTIDKLKKMRETATNEQLYCWSHRLMQAELEMSGNDAARTAAIEKHLERMKIMEERAEEGYRSGDNVILRPVGSSVAPP